MPKINFALDTFIPLVSRPAGGGWGGWEFLLRPWDQGRWFGFGDQNTHLCEMDRLD